MGKKKNILIHIILKPSQGQIVFTLFGVIGYLLYIYISRDIFKLHSPTPNITSYLTELSSTLLVCNLVVIGNRYISSKHFNKPLANKTLDFKRNINELIAHIVYAIVAINAVFLPETYFTSPSNFLSEMGIANLLSVPFSIIYYSIAHARRIITAYKEQNINLQKLEKEKLNTELQLLRAQFNPHFIFNAINVIYFQIENNDEEAIKSLPWFKQMLNYLTNYCSSKFVPLEKELEYLNNFINIQLLRQGDDIKADISIDINASHHNISPFLLQPFVENAFKYISGEMELEIKLSLVHDKLLYTVRNSVDPAFYSLPQKNGVGLKNLQKRLELVYPNRFYFNYNKIEKGFIAEMQLDLGK